jgi:Tfp pilus assembly protein PilO
MTNGLSSQQAKILTMILNLAFVVLIGCVSYLFVNQSQIAVKQAEMAEKYVLIDQYRVDAVRSEATVRRLEAKFEAFADRIDGKLDKIIMRQN